MDDVILTRQLLDQGYAPLTRAGDLSRIRRGAYARRSSTDDEVDEPASASDADRHRQLIAGTAPQLQAGAVLSHGSAGVLHDLPMFPSALQRVHVTRNRRGGGNRRSIVHVHGSPLTEAEIVLLDGIPVTSLARTVADLARTLPFDQAVAAGDRALRVGLEPTELAECLDCAARWFGAQQARRVAEFIDARSESAGESFSRVRMCDVGVPAPELQLEVFNDNGVFVGRSDFGWREQRTLGEFDGMEKYLRLRRPGESIEEAVIREKRREDALRDLGWQMVRWIWAELFTPHVIADRLYRAFDRAHR
jgi:hypothetical protein